MSHDAFVTSIAVASDLEDVVALLATNELPHADVHRHVEQFIVVRSGDELIATAGLERYGRDALLRSVCVASSHRGRGLGHRVCDAIEAHAKQAGVERLWLLTTTAPTFFARRQFDVAPRDAAPTVIMQTEEFRSLCPASAVCMTRGL